MKKLVSIIIVTALIFMCAGISASAEGTEVSVPKIEIITENGNGASLQKADGYVNAEITITDGVNTPLSGSVLFKVRGNSTAMSSISKKAFTFKFDKKTDVLGMGKGKKWALLANCFDPTLLRNYTAFELAREMGVPYTSEQRIAELWLDGEYRGCYTVYEPVQQGKDRVDLDIESNGGKNDFLIELESTRVEEGVTYLSVGGVRFAVSEPEEPDAEQTAYITSVMTDIVNTLQKGDEHQIRSKIDVESFAKIYFLNEFIKNQDFGYSSVFFFYKNGKLYAGPPWDYDLSLGNVNGELNSANAKAASVSDGIMQDKKNLYKWLCNKDWFQNEIKLVFLKNYGYIKNISADGGMLDSLRAQYSGVINRNFQKWSVKRWWLNYQKIPFATYEENYAFLKQWTAERTAWLSDYYGVNENSYVLGDTDRDYYVTISDVTAAQKTLAELPVTEFNSEAADVDGSGLNIDNITTIQRYIAGFEEPYKIGGIMSGAKEEK